MSTSLPGHYFHCLPLILRIMCLSAGGTTFIISKLCLHFFLFNRSSYKGSFKQNLIGSAKIFWPKTIPHLYVIGQICSFCPSPSLPCFWKEKNIQNTRKVKKSISKVVWCYNSVTSSSTLNFFETACQVENGIRAKLIWSQKEMRINLKSALRRKVDLKMDAWHWCKPNHLLLPKDF